MKIKIKNAEKNTYGLFNIPFFLSCTFGSLALRTKGLEQLKLFNGLDLHLDINNIQEQT